MHEDVDFPACSAPRPVPAAQWEAAERFNEQLKKKLKHPIARDTTCPTQKAMRKHRIVVRGEGRDRTNPRVLAKLLAIWDFEPGITQNKWADDTATKKRLKDEITALHADFREKVVEPYLRAWRQYVYGLAIPVLLKARERHRVDRMRDSTLNYGDLLQLTARLLRNNADVRRALQAKYRWIFVDEFQDTDPIQAEILFLLAGPPAVAGGLQPAGQLFVVGDPKQSIFRFTRADIATYNDVRRRFESGMGEVLSLTTNFRSVPELCEWANEVFKQRFPATPTPQSPQFRPLDPAPPEAKQGGQTKPEGPPKPKGLFTLTIPATVTKNADVAAAEAARIARYIRAEVDAGRRSYGSFLILTRMRRKHLTPYAQALEALQIPIEVSGAGAFGESGEVKALALLLRALADPQDGVSLLGVLRGALYGLSDPELFDYRQSGGRFSIFAKSSHPVGVALASLGEMHRWTRTLPAGAALELILERTGYLALAATTPGGVEAGDLLHAIDRVRAVAESGGSLLDAATALDEDIEESGEVESLPLEPGRSDVVRLMNLHRAKGLEADVVFLADPCGSPDPWVDIRIVRPPDGSALGYLQIAKKKGEYGKNKEVVALPENWDTHDAEEMTYLQAEGERLLYVAATRAREACVIGRWAKPSDSERAWSAFEAHLASAVELPEPKTVSVPAEQKVELSAAAARKAEGSRGAAHDRARQASWAAASVTAESKPRHGSKDLEPVVPVVTVVPDPTPSARADAGIAWGTLVHGLLEHAMRHKDATRDDLRRLAMWLTVEEPDLRPVIEQALDTAQAMASADFWPAARASAEHHEEAPFSIRETKDGLPLVLTGTIDLVYRDDGGWQIKDYKTDADVDAAALRERYAMQIEAYRKAWEQIGGSTVAAGIVGARKA
jgi:ATP-dependent helicase/nuclease subunit A